MLQHRRGGGNHRRSTRRRRQRSSSCSKGAPIAREDPSPFRPPTSIAKYHGETKPELWLADFRLAGQLGGARGDDRDIIRQLPLFLSDTARRWLEELLSNQIHDWTNLVRVFEGNFKGTYIRTGNSWDLLTQFLDTYSGISKV